MNKIEQPELFERLAGEKYLVGKHLVLFALEDSLQMHINKGFEEVEGDNIFTYSRNLLSETLNDFATLASKLETDEVFRTINSIYGVAFFPPSLGERYGFKIEEFPMSKLRTWLYKSFVVGKRKLRGNTNNLTTLTKFSMEKGEFIRRFGPQKDKLDKN